MDLVGLLIFGIEVWIVDDGEILVKGEFVMYGYWCNEVEIVCVLCDGWFYIGDIGEIDVVGWIMIIDCKKDLIINDKGENVVL